MKQNIPFAKSNAFLDSIEASIAFETALKVTQTALLDQWVNSIASDLIDSAAKIAGARRFSRNVKKATGETQAELAWTVGPLALNRTERLTLRNKLLTTTNKNMGMLGQGSKYNDYLRRYLRRVANFSGQDVLNSIAKETGTEPLKFRLSKKPYRNLIKARVKSLVKGLDGTSKRRMAAELIKGFEIGANKKQMIKRLTQVAEDLTWKRADLIVKTETGAVAEWMRWKTAELNGVEYKQWVALMDERTCPVCSNLHGQLVRIDEPFSDGQQIPPAHARCRCFLRYSIKESLATNAIKKSTVWEVIDEFLKSDPKDFYERKKLKSERPLPVINPEALWAGGESLVGKDRSVGRRIKEIEATGLEKVNKALLLAVENAYENNPGARVSLLVAAIQNGGTEESGDLLLQARTKLTPEGYVQISKYFGYTGKVNVKET